MIKQRVCVIQTDTRPTLDYLLRTQKVNQKCCRFLRYDYYFLPMIKMKNIHPATQKIFVIHDFLQEQKNHQYDSLVFLDSDAWIQDPKWLRALMYQLMKEKNRHGCFSRDPYLKINTFINSGSFLLKINDFTRKMYDTIIRKWRLEKTFHNQWPFDQYYISDFVFSQKDKFLIFVPDVLNTPVGKVLRHNWWKNEKMYHDLQECDSLSPMDVLYSQNHRNIPLTSLFDTQPFPNTNDDAKNYIS